VESNWNYDKLGRVASQAVQTAPGPIPVVRQDLSYFGNDPKTLTHYLGATPSQFNYGYDLRHQLTSVAATALGYFDASYTFGGAEAHYGTAGAVTHGYSHLSKGTPVARVDRTGNDSTAIEYQFHGIASNTIAAVSQNGTINAAFSYAPFGQVVEATDLGGAAA